MESLQFRPISTLCHLPSQSCKTSSFVTVLESLSNLKSYPKTKVREIIPTAPGVLTVAISGCTSSGKTTLALLLSEVFSSLSVTKESTENSPLDSEKDNPGDSNVTTSSATPFTTTIHQDAFFIPKAYCPFVEFNSTHNDKNFMKQSVTRIDENPVYFYSWTGTEGEGNVRITGPNTDCMGAVDFGNLLRKVQAAQSGKVEPEKNAKFKDDADRTQLVEQYSGVIASMRKKVKERLALATINNSLGDGGNTAEDITGWVFVEGFLLFSKSIPSNDRNSGLDETDEGSYAEVVENLRPKVKEEFVLIEKEMLKMREESISSKEALMEEFDIKLFLPTSKEAAKHRRLSRFPYVDFPAGGRHPGQMWKSEGYFEEVVWKGYEDSYNWLLKETGKENVNGVHVRPTFDDTVENTLEWAIDIIVEILGTKAKNKRCSIE